MQLAVNIVVLASIYALISCGYVLIYRVVAGALARPRRADDARRLRPLRHRLAVLRPSARSRWPPPPCWPSCWACAVYFLLMRHMTGEIGAGRRAHHHRARHPAARRHRAGVGRAEQHPLHVLGWRNVALSVGPSRQDLRGGPDAGAGHRRRLSRPVAVPAPDALGHPHARGRSEPAARRAARHRPARHLRPGLGPGHLHRRPRRHADRVRLRRSTSAW